MDDFLMAVSVIMAIASFALFVLGLVKMRKKKWFHYFTALFIFIHLVFNEYLIAMGIDLKLSRGVEIFSIIMVLCTFFRVVIFLENVKKEVEEKQEGVLADEPPKD